VTEATRADRVWTVVSAHANSLDVPVSLRLLCQAAAARLPVSGVAVSVHSGRVVSEVLCAIGPLSRELEELQLTVGEGPSLQVLAGGPSVLVSELDSAEQQARWPLFAAAAVGGWGPGAVRVAAALGGYPCRGLRPVFGSPGVAAGRGLGRGVGIRRVRLAAGARRAGRRRLPGRRPLGRLAVRQSPRNPPGHWNDLSTARCRNR